MTAQYSLRRSNLAFSLALLIVAIIPIALWISGCGSGSAGTGSAVGTKNTARGRATFTFRWPKRSVSARLIPIDANSIQISVTAADGTVVATQLIARPGAGATSATAEFDNLIVGTYTVTATAFPNADGSGNAQAQAQTSVTIVANQLVPITLTMASTITSLTITPQQTGLSVGQSVVLIATPTDAQGNIVLTASSTIQWSSSAPAIAPVDATGKVSGVAQGQAVITATETESGQTATLALTVSSVLSINLPKSVSYQLNPSHSGSTSWGVPLSLPASPAWSKDMGSDLLSFPLIAQGKVFITTSYTPNGTSGQLYALNAATGQNAWGPITVSGSNYILHIAYENGRVFVLNLDGILRSFDAASGTPQWSLQLTGQSFYAAPPVAVNGVVYVVGAGYGGTEYAVDEATGNLLWTSSTTGATLDSPTISLNSTGLSTGFFLASGCTAYELDPSSGAALWTDTADCAAGGSSDSAASANGLLYSPGDAGGQIYDVGSGQVVGTYGTGLIPAVTTTSAFLVGNAGLQKLDLSLKQSVWTFGAPRGIATPPIVIDQTVFIGTGLGVVYAVDANSGAQLWVGSVPTIIEGLDTSAGMAAGEGYLVFPLANTLTAWHIAGQ